MVLPIMIRVNISCYRKELVRSYYHDNSLIRCMEMWLLAQKSTHRLGSSQPIQAHQPGGFMIIAKTLIFHNYFQHVPSQ